jgi:hypothetical protein
VQAIAPPTRMSRRGGRRVHATAPAPPSRSPRTVDDACAFRFPPRRSGSRHASSLRLDWIGSDRPQPRCARRKPVGGRRGHGRCHFFFAGTGTGVVVAVGGITVHATARN